MSLRTLSDPLRFFESAGQTTKSAGSYNINEHFGETGQNEMSIRSWLSSVDYSFAINRAVVL